jgi:putative ABC transport system permease protein
MKLLDEVGQDVRYAMRSLARNPAFAFVTVLTLAIGVGANTAIFSVIRAVLLAPPLYRSEGLVRLGERPPQSTNQSVAISGPTFGDWAEQNRVFSAIAAVTGGGMTLSGIGPAPIYIEARTVSASYFDVFGLRPLLGRTFAPGEEEPDKRQVVVISHTLWLSQFGSNPDVIGTRVRLDGEPYTVIGVMPPGAAVEVFDPAAWVPRDMSRGGVFAAGGPPQRDVRDLRWVAARLRPGVTVEKARREMDAVGDRLAQAYPDTNKGWGVSVEPWPRPLGRNFAQSLYLLFGAVGLVLAIGCVNIASLSLARTAAGASEVATRTALGAGRGRLIRQFLTEHLVIATIGGAFGLMVSVALLHVLTAGIPSSGAFRAVPSALEVNIDGSVWLFAFGLSALCGIVSGLGPAIGAAVGPLAPTIKRGAPGLINGRWPRGVRACLGIVEVALAFVLLAGALRLIESFVGLQQRIGVGFDSNNVITARLPIPPTRFAQPDTLNAHLDRIVERVQVVPGVQDVALAEGLPTQGAPFGRAFQIADQPRLPAALRPGEPFKTVSASYFRTLRLQVRAGRALTERDRRGSPLAIVVNETFARRYFADADPIGKRLWMEPYRPEDVWEVVGVVADEGLSWQGEPEAMAYASREQHPSDYLALVVRGSIDPIHLREPLHRAISSVDADQALTDVRLLNDLKGDFMASDRLRSILLSSFAAVAVSLAAIGLYGSLAYLVAQRQREIGIRAALGASGADLVALIMRHGIVVTGWGVAIGVAGTLMVHRLVSIAAFSGAPGGVVTILTVVGIVSAVAMTACFIPARRAAQIDPLVALRAD